MLILIPVEHTVLNEDLCACGSVTCVTENCPLLSDATDEYPSEEGHLRTNWVKLFYAACVEIALTRLQLNDSSRMDRWPQNAQQEQSTKQDTTVARIVRQSLMISSILLMHFTISTESEIQTGYPSEVWTDRKVRVVEL